MFPRETIEALAPLHATRAAAVSVIWMFHPSGVFINALAGVVCDRLITNLHGERGNYRAQTNYHN